ncbi:MAG: nucleotidyltransferase domain-containing protein [Pseudomonadota bacterium]
MSKIEFVSTLSPEMRETILVKLQAMEAEHDVKVIFAIESGSRAWGFPSPDSDYDARFVYARPVDWYLSVSPGRDVIELPIEGDLDINGWDIKKALGLLLKPNPVLLEWLSSPIQYIWNGEVCSKLKALGERVGHGPSCLHHYLNLGESLWKRHLKDEEEVKIKRYFYVLRPAMALRWLRMHSDKVPPMNFQDLMAGVDLDADLTEELRRLLLAKSQTNELGFAPRIPILDAFVLDEYEKAKQAAPEFRKSREDLRPEADDLFRDIVKGGW